MMLVWLRLAPWLGMKLEIRPFPNQNASELHVTKRETAADKLVLAEFAFGTLAGVISFVAAVFTTVVEVPGPWRSFWLLICIASFACAAGLIVAGARNFGKRA
jgi:hypothetical protein